MLRKHYRIILLPLLASFNPVIACKYLFTGLFKTCCHFFKKFLSICPYRHIYVKCRLFHLIFTYIIHYNISLSCPCLPVITDLPYAKSVTNGKYKVRILYSKITSPVTHNSASSYIERMFIIYLIYTVPACSNRNIKKFNNFLKALITA